jgi:hypothetical protein
MTKEEIKNFGLYTFSMDRNKRLQKSESARTKRNKTKEIKNTIEKRKYADAKNLKKKYKKIEKSFK